VHSLDLQRRPIVAIQLSADSFSSNWVHCQQLADFLARVAASDRHDAEHHATLLSHFLNELLELVYRLHAPARVIQVCVFKTGDELLVEFTIPINDDTERAYRELFSTLGDGDSREFLRQYIQKLPTAGSDSETSFLELAGIYKMKLELRSTDARAQTLVLSMPVNFD
jgi:hypothetical protein